MRRGGFKRSRALWDNVRLGSDGGSSRSGSGGAWLRAILYELQPIRFSQIRNHNLQLLHLLWLLLGSCHHFITNTLPRLLHCCYCFFYTIQQVVRSLTRKQWLWITAVVLYYYVIRWIHEILHAGPFVVILTALVGIFTIGLGDDTTAAGGGLSAYSVFNRGFEKLLGSIDADALLAQHIGGGMPMPVPPQMGDDDNDDVARRNQDRDLQERRRQLLPAAAAAPNHHDNVNEQGNEQQLNAADAPNRARRSGKKARRKTRRSTNVEQRREIQRQRDAAMAMGFGGNEQEDMAAMQRLIEDQVAVAAVAAGPENDE